MAENMRFERKIPLYLIVAAFSVIVLLSGCNQTGGVDDGHQLKRNHVTIQDFYNSASAYPDSDVDLIPEGTKVIPFSYYGRTVRIHTVSGKNKADAYRWLQKHNFYEEIVGDKKNPKLIEEFEKRGLSIQKLSYLLEKIGEGNLSCFLYDSGMMYISDLKNKINYVIPIGTGMADAASAIYK